MEEMEKESTPPCADLLVDIHVATFGGDPSREECNFYKNKALRVKRTLRKIQERALRKKANQLDLERRAVHLLEQQLFRHCVLSNDLFWILL